MKKTLLWLGPLACLALACPYTYAWFNPDPLVVAFERIEIGMTEDEVAHIVGQAGTKSGEICHCEDFFGSDIVIWSSKGRALVVIFQCLDRRVLEKQLLQESVFDALLRRMGIMT
jgi:hypothetical protein